MKDKSDGGESEDANSINRRPHFRQVGWWARQRENNLGVLKQNERYRLQEGTMTPDECQYLSADEIASILIEVM